MGAGLSVRERLMEAFVVSFAGRQQWEIDLSNARDNLAAAKTAYDASVIAYDYARTHLAPGGRGQSVTAYYGTRETARLALISRDNAQTAVVNAQNAYDTAYATYVIESRKQYAVDDRNAIAQFINRATGYSTKIINKPNATADLTEINRIKGSIATIINNAKIAAQGKGVAIVKTASSLDTYISEGSRIVSSIATDESDIQAETQKISTATTNITNALNNIIKIQTAAAVENADTKAELAKATAAYTIAFDNSEAARIASNNLTAAVGRIANTKTAMVALESELKTKVDMINTINNALTIINEKMIAATSSVTAVDKSATVAKDDSDAVDRAVARINKVNVTTLTAEKTAGANAKTLANTAAANAKKDLNTAIAEQKKVSDAYTTLTKIISTDTILTQTNADTATTLKDTAIAAATTAATIATNAAGYTKTTLVQNSIAEAAATAAEAADKIANDTLTRILQAYTNEKSNNITTAIENEIANSSQIATTFGVVSQYNDMKTAWTTNKTVYDDVVRSIQTYLAMADKAAALNEYNKVKDALAKSILTANNNYNTAKTAFNSVLASAQKESRATEWMGTNRPGCRNLVSSSSSINNMQCNDNEYIYGFKNTDNAYYYTCCATPKGTVGTGGLPGLQGPIGPQGTRGLQGAKGPQGAQGQQGAQGPQGAQGIKGENIRGPKGPPGKKGKQGAVGPRGSSVELGNDVIIKQIAGAPGIKGEIGLRGPKGAQGQQGPMGAKGKTGKDGKDGDEEDVEYVSSPFNRATIYLLDISDRIANMVSSKV